MKILKFSSNGCVPCAQLSRWIDANQELFREHTLEEVNHEFHKDLFKDYNIRSVPHMVFIDGEECIMKEIRGFEPEAIKKFLACSAGS
jgi:thioredoxin-related protein